MTLFPLLSSSISTMRESTGEIIPLIGANNSQTSSFPVKTKRLVGILLGLASAFCLSTASLIVQSFSRYHPFTVTTWTSLGVFIVSIPLILTTIHLRTNGYAQTFGIGPGMNTGRENLKLISLMLIRSFITCTGNILFVSSLDHISLGDATAIYSSTPVIVTLLAHCLLGEKAGWGSVLIVILTVVGGVVIARPTFLTHQTTTNGNALVGVLCGAGALVMSALSLIIVRRLRLVHYTLLTLSYGIAGTIESLSLASATRVLDHPHGIKEWGFLTSLILALFLSEAFLVLALKFEKAGPISLVQLTGVIFSFLLQFAVLGVPPDKYRLIGGLLVILGVSLTTIRKWKETPSNEMRYPRS